ncbi:MAG TPA: hypothetical protein VF462_12420 [Micromonosporaceae bacterium]
MTRSIRAHRRATLLLAGLGAAGSLLLSGCGAGQIAQTAAKAPAVPGVNAQIDAAGGSYMIRNLVVSYRDPKGYPAGSNAPVEVAIFNETDTPVTVRVTSDSARAVVLAGATALPTPPAAAPTPGGPAASASGGGIVNPTEPPTVTRSPKPTGSVQPLPTPSSVPAGGPANLEIPARSFVLLNRTGGRFLQLEGLNQELRPGQSVNLTFDFNGHHISTAVPVTVPLSPAPKGSPVTEEAGQGHAG